MRPHISRRSFGTVGLCYSALRVALAGTSLLGGVASAQEAEALRPTMPGYALAGDDGAGAVFVNPANLGLDPDNTYFLQARGAGPDAGHVAVAGAFNLGVLGTGLAYVADDGPTGAPADRRAAWRLSESIGLDLGRGFAMGGGPSWVFPDGGGSRFVTGDLAATYRPTRWIGAAARLDNLGLAARDRALPLTVSGGVSVRPSGDRALVSVDVHAPIDAPAGSKVSGVAAARVRVMDGLVVRASGSTLGAIGLGVELGYGGQAMGGFLLAPVGNDAATPPLGASVYAQSLQRDGELRGPKPKIAAFDLTGALPYQPQLGFFARSDQTYLDLLERLSAAARDASVTGVLLDLDGAKLSLAQVEELRRIVKSMRNQGKVVVAWLGGAPGNASYMLAAAADKVYMHPAGELELIGLSAELQYYRGALDLLGVEPTVAKRSTYKSAPERFTHTEGSDGSREQMNALLNDLSAAWAEGIAAGRGREAADVWSLVDNAPYSAREAEGRGLVDALLYPDEVEDRLDELFSGDVVVVSGTGDSSGTDGWRAQKEIAVLYVTGAITGGESAGPGFFGGGFTTGSETVVRQLDAAREDDAVKAIVIRVDSPGGSAFASEEIWRAVERVKKVDKPVIVSMGDVAASGGYYVATNADAIFANATTITGSIGVYFGPLLSLEGLYDKVGVNTELYSRGRHSAMYSSSKTPDASELAAIDRMVGETYTQFKRRVELGRSLDGEKVEQVARGRVWSGQAASQNGLVDEIGGFQDALQRAREEAGLRDDGSVTFVTYSARLGPNREAMKRSIRAVADTLGLEPPVKPGIPEIAELQALEQLLRLGDDRVWAMMPMELEVR